MQAALPIAQPVRLPAYGFLAVALVGLIVVPAYGNADPPVNMPVSNPATAELRDVEERRPISKVNEHYGTGAGTGTWPDEVLEDRSLAIAASEARRMRVEALEGRYKKIEALEARQMSVETRKGIRDTSQEGVRALIIQEALSWQGVPYTWGGKSRAGIDCSALVQMIYQNAGVEMPRTSYEQFRIGVGVPRNQLEPGDLVFFSTNGAGASHVGIYLEEQKFISATQRQVEVQSLETYYWKKAYRGSRRVF